MSDPHLARKLQDFEHRAIHCQNDAREALEIWSLIRDEVLVDEPSMTSWFVVAADAVESALLNQVDAWRVAPPAVRADMVSTIDAWMRLIAERWSVQRT